MSWDDVDNKHKKAIDSLYVSCEESYEIEYLVKIIREEYPWLAEITIRTAIASCCVTITAPRPRDTFLQCLRANLGV